MEADSLRRGDVMWSSVYFADCSAEEYQSSSGVADSESGIGICLPLRMDNVRPGAIAKGTWWMYIGVYCNHRGTASRPKKKTIASSIESQKWNSKRTPSRV